MSVRLGDVSVTPESFEQHLRHELEDGAITYSDYERTKQFASRNQHFNRVTNTAGTIASGWSIYYGRWHRRRPWSWPTTLMIAPLAFVAGMVPGVFYRVYCAWRFQGGLDDQKGLSEALGRIFRQHQHQQTDVSGDRNVAGGDESESEVRTGEHAMDIVGDVAQRNRWAELRKASTPVSNSTWDKIRQSHETSGKAQSNPEQPQSGSSRSAGVERQTEQAKFDALLEAERKASS